MRCPLIVAGCLILAACATPAERARQMEEQMTRMVDEFGPACERLGYTQATDPWRDCILRLSTQQELRYQRPYPNFIQCFGTPGSVFCNSF